MSFLPTLRSIPLAGRIFHHRFIKFGVVGFSGTLINMGVLYVSQSFLFSGVSPPEIRLHLSLSLAIFLATFNNYLWNRWWTWKDRRRTEKRGFVVQMVQYYLACGLAILLQYLLTTLLSRAVHYLIANLTAIGLSAILVYMINDIWTFTQRKQIRASSSTANAVDSGKVGRRDSAHYLSD